MLHNYVLWYNQYENIWYAINRDTQIYFFNGNRAKSIYLSDKSVNSLIKKLK